MEKWLYFQGSFQISQLWDINQTLTSKTVRSHYMFRCTDPKSIRWYPTNTCICWILILLYDKSKFPFKICYPVKGTNECIIYNVLYIHTEYIWEIYTGLLFYRPILLPLQRTWNWLTEYQLLGKKHSSCRNTLDGFSNQIIRRETIINDAHSCSTLLRTGFKPWEFFFLQHYWPISNCKTIRDLYMQYLLRLAK